MLTIEIKRGKFKGEYKIYEEGDELYYDSLLIALNPPFPLDRLSVGRYIKDSQGLIAQVLRIHYLDNKRETEVEKRHRSVVITTPFGIDNVYDVYTFPLDPKRNYIKWATLNFRRSRRNFYSFASSAKKTELNKKDRFFIRQVCLGCDIFKAYKLAYGLEVDTVSKKYNCTVLLQNLFSTEGAKEVMAGILKDLLHKKGIDNPEWYLDKMLESLAGGIEKPVQWEIFKALANASGDEDIQKLVGGGMPESAGMIAIETTEAQVLEDKPREQLQA
jgi:hypothetical protein